MAKQSGIHQIKGKVGEMSYYRQKGVGDGLLRKINQGLSARVKTDDAFANTRLNNAEFKNANEIATAAFKSVNTRQRGMMVNFAIARMTKRALEAIKEGAGTWGQRTTNVELDALICDMLENYAKGGSYDNKYGTFVVNPLNSDGEVTVTFDIPEAKQLELLSLGIDTIQPVVSWCLAGENEVGDIAHCFAGYYVSPGTPMHFTGADDVFQDLVHNVSTPSSVGMSGSGYAFATEDPKHGFFAVVTLLPLRTVGAQRYILQEYATYFAIPLGQVPEE